MWVAVSVPQNHTRNGRARTVNINVLKLHLKKQRCGFKKQRNDQIKMSDTPLFYDLTSLHKRKQDGCRHIACVQFSSVTQSCPTLFNPMDCSMLGFPVHHQLPEFTHTHVHQVGDASQPSHPVIPFSSRLQSSPASGSFQMSQFFASGGQSTGVSASASVLPMNIQD